MGNQFSQKQCQWQQNAVIQRKRMGKRPPRWSSFSYNVSSLCRAIHTEDWRRAIALSQTLPELCKLWCFRQAFWDGRDSSSSWLLPLHEAVGSPSLPPLALIRSLLSNYPKALRKPDSKYQRLPLHCACRMSASVNIKTQEEDSISPEQHQYQMIHLLLQKYPQACVTQDALGRVPLHYAFSNNASPKIIQLLLDQAPGAAACADQDGWTPIHVAVSQLAESYDNHQNNQPQQQRQQEYFTIVCQMIQQHPQVVWMKTKQGTSLMDYLKATVANANDKNNKSQTNSKQQTNVLLLQFLQRMEKHAESTIKVPSLNRKTMTLTLSDDEDDDDDELNNLDHEDNINSNNNSNHGHHYAEATPVLLLA